MPVYEAESVIDLHVYQVAVLVEIDVALPEDAGRNVKRPGGIGACYYWAYGMDTICK